MNIGKVIGQIIRLATSLVGCGRRYELRPLFLGIALEWFGDGLICLSNLLC